MKRERQKGHHIYLLSRVLASVTINSLMLMEVLLLEQHIRPEFPPNRYLRKYLNSLEVSPLKLQGSGCS